MLINTLKVFDAFHFKIDIKFSFLGCFWKYNLQFNVCSGLLCTFMSLWWLKRDNGVHYGEMLFSLFVFELGNNVSIYLYLIWSSARLQVLIPGSKMFLFIGFGSELLIIGVVPASTGSILYLCKILFVCNNSVLHSYRDTVLYCDLLLFSVMSIFLRSLSKSCLHLRSSRC